MSTADPKQILVIDVGGHHVKLLVTGKTESRRFTSGPSMTPQQMVKGVRKLVGDWAFDAVSIGYPGPVIHGRVAREPRNLGKGWLDFDFDAAFDAPVKLINDATMQALGSYQGGRMLFLGLGTGLGSAMIVDDHLLPMELGHLPYRKGRTFEDYIGARGFERLGKQKWRKHVLAVIDALRAALEPEYVVVGGGNAEKFNRWTHDVHLGHNDHAFAGGLELWNDRPAPEVRGLAVWRRERDDAPPASAG